MYTLKRCKTVVGIYYCFTMALIAVSTIVSTLIVYISQSNSQRPVPIIVVAVGYHTILSLYITLYFVANQIATTFDGRR